MNDNLSLFSNKIYLDLQSYSIQLLPKWDSWAYLAGLYSFHLLLSLQDNKYKNNKYYAYKT